MHFAGRAGTFTRHTVANNVPDGSLSTPLPRSETPLRNDACGYANVMCPLSEPARPNLDTCKHTQRSSSLFQPVVAPRRDFACEVERAAAFGGEDGGSDLLELLVDGAQAVDLLEELRLRHAQEPILLADPARRPETPRSPPRPSGPARPSYSIPFVEHSSSQFPVVSSQFSAVGYQRSC